MQVLFDPVQYAALEAEAERQKQSVAAIIRESVDARLRSRTSNRQEALERMIARADARPDEAPIDWEAEKEGFERPYLRDLP